MDSHSHISAWSSLDTMLSKLRELREDRKYCDIVFVGDNGHEFYCHKNILALFTDVFSASCNFKIQSNDEEMITRIKLEELGISVPIFEKILDIIYGKKPEIVVEEAVDLLYDADKLLMNNVRTYVEDVIVDRNFLEGNHRSLVRMCNFPGLRKCQKLLGYVKTYVHGNFPAVSQLPEFYKISVQELCCLDILKKKSLFGCAETCVDFICRWITYDLDNRIVDIKAIGEHLKNPSVGPDDGELVKFVSTIANIRKSNEDPDAIISLLRFSLKGLFADSIKSHFDANHPSCPDCKSRLLAQCSNFNNANSQRQYACGKCRKFFVSIPKLSIM